MPGGFGVPHDEHAADSAVPHSPQNFLPGSFSVPHAEHVMDIEG